jgi:hypothetical protein
MLKDEKREENYTTEGERVSNQNARKFTAGLPLYFMQEGTEGGPISALETCADFVQLQSINRRQQGALCQFLQRH